MLVGGGEFARPICAVAGVACLQSWNDLQASRKWVLRLVMRPVGGDWPARVDRDDPNNTVGPKLDRHAAGRNLLGRTQGSRYVRLRERRGSPAHGPTPPGDGAS